MKKFVRNFLLLILFDLALMPAESNATSIVKLEFDQICQRAELIFEGEVVSTRTDLSPVSGYPFTYITFQIIDIIKGSYHGSMIELAFLGGQKNGNALQVFGMHVPHLHERGVFFVETTNSEQVHPLVGWDQGHYLIKSDPSSGNQMVVPMGQSRSALTAPRSLKNFKQSVRTSMSKPH